MAAHTRPSKSSNSGRIFVGILILILLAVYSTKDWIDALFQPSSQKSAVEDDYQRNATSILSMTTDVGRDNNVNERYKSADMKRAYMRFHQKNASDAPTYEHHMHAKNSTLPSSTHNHNHSSTHKQSTASANHHEHNILNSSQTSGMVQNNATISATINGALSGSMLQNNVSLIFPPHVSASDEESHKSHNKTATSSSTKKSNTTSVNPISTSSSSSSTSFIVLPIPDTNTKAPISLDGCCGIGHRLARNIPSMVYAISHHRQIHVNWTSDVPWNVLFNDTPQIQQGPRAEEHYGNDFPNKWNDNDSSLLPNYNSSSLTRTNPLPNPGSVTAYRRYGPVAHQLFEMPLAQSIVKLLSDNLSPLVLSFLDPIRSQYANNRKHQQSEGGNDDDGGLHLCVHIREGNNETGDWEKKDWRHIDFESTLNRTLVGMMNYTATTASASAKHNASSPPKVSVFVASDNAHARTWFEHNTPNKHWRIIQPTKTLPRPKSGVWFGELTSSTNSQLSKEQLNDAMAEAVADVFALGECDALFIPNYSSFSIVGIILARAKGKKVYFHWWGDRWVEYAD